MSVLEGEKKPEPKPVEPVVEQEVNNVEEVCVNYINEQLFSPAPFSVPLFFHDTNQLQS